MRTRGHTRLEATENASAADHIIGTRGNVIKSANGPIVSKAAGALFAFALGSSCLFAQPQSTIAADPAVETATYLNARYHTTFKYPKEFIQATAAISGDRSVDAFVDPADASTSVSVVYSPIPADYTRLTSFGGKENIRSYVLPRGEGVTSEVIEGAYPCVRAPMPRSRDLLRRCCAVAALCCYLHLYSPRKRQGRSLHSRIYGSSA
jgi:PsbP